MQDAAAIERIRRKYVKHGDHGRTTGGHSGGDHGDTALFLLTFEFAIVW